MPLELSQKIKLNKNIVANYIGGVWSSLMAILPIPLYIKYLGIESYGLIGAFSAIQIWFYVLDLGLTPTLSREIAQFKSGTKANQEINNLLRSLEVIYLGIGLCIMIAMILLGPWIAVHWVRSENIASNTISQSLTILGIYIVIRWLSGLYKGGISGLAKNIWLNTNSSIFSTLRGFGVIVALIIVTATINTFLIYQCILGLVELVMLRNFIYKNLDDGIIKPRFSWVALKNIHKFAAGMGFNMFQVLLLTQTDKLMLTKIVSLTEFAYYSLASTVAGGMFVIVGAITNVAYPALSKLIFSNDILNASKEYHQYSKLVSIITIPIAMIMIFFSKTILELWTRDTSLANSTYSVLSLLAIGNLINCLMQMPYYLQIAHGWTSYNLKVNCIALVFILPSTYLLVPKYGIIIAPIIWILFNLFYIIIAPYYMHKKIFTGEIAEWYVIDIIKPLSWFMMPNIGIYFLYNAFNFQTDFIKFISMFLIFLVNLLIAYSLYRGSDGKINNNSAK